MPPRQKIEFALAALKLCALAMLSISAVRFALYLISREYIHSIDCAAIVVLCGVMHIVANLARDLLALLPERP